MDEDAGCEDMGQNEGEGPGFSLPEGTLINFTLQPVIEPIFNFSIRENLTYAGPIGNSVSIPGEDDIIESVGVITSALHPGENLGITITFRNESLRERYIHQAFLANPLTGEKRNFHPTVIELNDGQEFGERWEIHLFSGITGNGYFMLYKVTKSGLEELQRGEVTLSGSRASFTITGFSELFPERVYMRIRGYSTESESLEFTYPAGRNLLLEAKLGRISYYAYDHYEEALDRRFRGVTVETLGNGINLTLEFKTEQAFRAMSPILLYIDDDEDGEPDHIIELGRDAWSSRDLGSGSVRTFEDPYGFDAEYDLTSLFSRIRSRRFLMWLAQPSAEFRFPRRSNLLVDATSGLTVDKDVERYLVVVVSDVYIKDNKDKVAEGEIELTSWAYAFWPLNGTFSHGPVYAFGYPVAHWVEAMDRSRLLYQDPEGEKITSDFINGYPVFAMPLEEAKKYHMVILKTVAWDRDEPGNYVSQGMGFLIDTALGFATGELSTVAKYGYDMVSASHYLLSGEGISSTWAEVFDWLVGAEPDRVGAVSYSIDPSKDYSGGVVVKVPSDDGNMLVSYVVYEVDVPRILKRTSAKAVLTSVHFTKDTEKSDDEYYFYLRGCTGFAPGNKTVNLPGKEVVYNAMVPYGHSYVFPKDGHPGLESFKGKTVRGLGDYSVGACSPAKKLSRGYIVGNRGVISFSSEFVHLNAPQEPFIYLEYQGWEEDAGKWGDDDDPMGGFGVTVLLDDDYFLWGYDSGIPTRSWYRLFEVAGVSGGNSAVGISFVVSP